MKILLIRPYWPYPYNKGENTYNRIWPPLSLATCAAILEREGHEVKILDAHALRLKPKKIHSHAQGFDKIFITSSSLDRWICPNIHIESFLQTTKAIKSITDEFYIMGYHGTLNPNNILNLTEAKAVMRKEPELTTAKICKNIPFEQIQGLSYKRGDQIISNPDPAALKLEELPAPAYHLLSRYKYFYEILGKNFFLFEISRGCLFNCTFCSKIMYGPGLRIKTKEQIIKELKTAIEQYGIKTGYFIDLEFLSCKERVEEICDFLIAKKYNFKWCCQTRPDSIDPSLIKKMKKAGCELIHFGIESGMQKFLNQFSKNTTLNKITESINTCNKTGIKTLGFYIFGLKGEVAKDRDETFNFAKKINTDFVSFHKIHMYENTEKTLPERTLRSEIDKFIKVKLFLYYFRLSYLPKLNIFIFLRSLKLFFGRIISL